MSKFTLDKLKSSAGKSKTKDFPTFRYQKDGDRELMEVVNQDEEDDNINDFKDRDEPKPPDPVVNFQLGDLKNDVPSEDVIQAARETSPIKEAILTKFAKIAPDSGMSRSESTDSQESGSWMNQMKSRLAKTVENSVEKYTELKAERAAAKTIMGSSLDLEDPPPTPEPEPIVGLSHSQSEMLISETSCSQAPGEHQRPHSQIFDMDFTSQEMESLGSITDELLIGEEGGFKKRGKFNISSFLERSNPGSPVKTEVETPRRSLRARMMSYVGKSASPAHPMEVKLAAELQDDPFLGLSMESDLIRVEAIESAIADEPELEFAREVEETFEVIEDEVVPDGKTDDNASLLSIPAASQNDPPAQLPPPGFSSRELLPAVIFLFLGVINMTGTLPDWSRGFITGTVLSLLFGAWFLTWLLPKPTPTPPRSFQSITCIPEHGQPVRVQAWMNLYPPKFHPYDVDTYEVRNTFSVRCTVEHHMLKIEYPEKNICRRINEGEVLSDDIKFLLHSDHIDLTTAKISLLPENIATKRKFCKKYPIEIKPNALNKPADQITKAAQNAVVDDLQNEDDDDTFHDLDDVMDENLDLAAFDTLEDSKNPKVFYLFARADREKEDIYKAFLDGHFYVRDTLLDISMRESFMGQKIEDEERVDRESAQERSVKFKDFMGRVMGSHKCDREVVTDETISEDTKDKPNMDEEGLNKVEENYSIEFLNIYLNRIFYDIHKSENIKNLLKDRIYRKLLKIKITQWFKSIKVTDIDMGTILPKITSVSRPHQGDGGLWVELGIEYAGVASAAIETIGVNLGEDQLQPGVVNLKSLIEDPVDGAEAPGLTIVRPTSPERKISTRREAATNSDEEDSAEEDDEDSEEALQAPALALSEVTVETLQPKSRWWEVVGSSEIVKSGINKLSNSEWWKAKTSKKITLYLEVHALKGVIVLNIPPPPTDRIWYGFREKPHFDLRLVPYYGDVQLGTDKTIISTAINKGIEVVVNRLKEELNKFILMPNMDDIPIRIMDPLPTSNDPNCSNIDGENLEANPTV